MVQELKRLKEEWKETEKGREEEINDKGQDVRRCAAIKSLTELRSSLVAPS